MARTDSEKRAEILQAAIPVFAERGLGGAAIRDVARAAGVNSALIYYYFENKDALFAEAVRVVVFGLLDRLQGRRVFRNGRDRIAFLAGGLFDYYKAHPERLRFMGEAITRHPDLVGGVLSSFLRDGRMLPMEVIREGMERGEFKPTHPLQAWWSILGMVIFTFYAGGVVAHVDRAAMRPPMPAGTATAEGLVDVLCDGMLARGKRRTAKGSKVVR